MKFLDKIIDRGSFYTQNILYLFGINVHNNYRDECTPDFRCCCKEISKPSFKERLDSLIYNHKLRAKMRKLIKEEGR